MRLSPDTDTTRQGDTLIADYDLAIVRRLGGVESNGEFFVKVPGIDSPSYPDTYEIESLRRTVMPGLPITLAGPSDAVEDYVNPSFIIRRPDPELAMDRWQFGNLKYVVPARGFNPITATLSSGLVGSKIVQKTVTGYAQYETQEWPWPFDFHYSILFRVEGKKAEGLANRVVLPFLMRKFPPRPENLAVVDSLGQEIGFAMYVEGPISVSEVIDISQRIKGWMVNIRVLGYLDTECPENLKAQTSLPIVTTNQLEE